MVFLFDFSNNQIGDSGAQDVLTGLSNHIDQKGLNVLSLWNNELTHASSPHFCQVLVSVFVLIWNRIFIENQSELILNLYVLCLKDKSKSLVTLNVGKNAITNETIEEMKESLKKNHVLLQLGLQSTEITCDGIRVLVEILEANETLQVRCDFYFLSFVHVLLFNLFVISNRWRFRGLTSVH